MIRPTILIVLCLVSSPLFGQNKAPSTVSLRDATYPQVDEAVAGLKGKVVLVDVWSIYCLPCKKKFPSLLALHAKHAKDGLAVLTLAADDAEDRAKCLGFLEETKATTTNLFLLKTPKPSKELDEKYPSELMPTVILFDRAGKRVKQFDGKIKDEELEAEIERLLRSK